LRLENYEEAIMRIGLNTPDPQTISTEKPSTSSSSANGAISTNQKYEDAFSGDSVTLSSLAKGALDTPEIRQDKVDSLRQRISSGQYELDPKSIADAMLAN
jgi:flagellar biosynthesis anti-sigma factor FlgM